MPLTAIERRGGSHDFRRILDALDRREIKQFVIGLPLNMDGSEGPAARFVRAFGERLTEATGIAVDYFDERLTSFEAEERLKQSNPDRRLKREAIDAIAAAVILEGWLAAHARAPS